MSARWAWVAMLVVVPHAASANDATFGGRGADLQPLAETRLRMASEDIVMELTQPKRGRGRWEVVATYRFENPTAERVLVQLGFPEPACTGDDEGCGEHRGRFFDMRTSVRGKPVQHAAGQVSRDPKWSGMLGAVYTYDVAFEPNETVEVVHRYHMDASDSVDGKWVEYLTRTGRLWAGPIGRARFTVRTPERPWLLVFPPEYALASYREAPRKGGGSTTEIVFENASWTPERDFVLQLGNSMLGMQYTDTRCPYPMNVAQALRENIRELIAEERKSLAELSDAELLECRNLPYAHHGYAFDRQELHAKFYGPGIRHGQGDARSPASGDADGEAWSYLTFMPNDAYTPKLLSSDEHQYVTFVAREEARRRAKGGR